MYILYVDIVMDVTSYVTTTARLAAQYLQLRYCRDWGPAGHHWSGTTENCQGPTVSNPKLQVQAP